MGKRYLCLLLLILCGIFSGLLSAQTARIDSLKHQLINEPDVTRKCSILSDLYYATNFVDTLAAFDYIRQINNLLPEIKDSIGKAATYRCLADYYEHTGDYKEALKYFDASLHAVSSDPSDKAQEERGKTLASKGLVHQRNGDMETACLLYLEAEDILIRHKVYMRLVDLYGKMGELYAQTNQLEKDREVTKKCGEIIQHISDPEVIAYYYINLATTLDNQKEELALYHKAMDLVKGIDNHYINGIVYHNIGFVKMKQKEPEYKEAEKYLQKALSEIEQTGVEYDIGDVLLSFGECFYDQKKYSEAESFVLRALKIAEDIKSNLLKRNCFDRLAKVEYNRMDFRKAYNYLHGYLSLDIQLMSEQNKKQMGFLTARYESERKEAKIKEMENQHTIQQGKLRLRNVWLFSMVSIIVLLLIGAVLYKRYVYHKEMSILDRIRRLEQEKQLVATQAVLDGETAERTRLARDLHDGLGGMLSVVKLGLHNMKGGVTLEKEDVDRFNKVMDMLDDSIRELRRMAHNMMPESLARYGLKASLSDFCGIIPGAEFHYYGTEERLEQKLEVMIFRTAQELVNNALKHAEAEHINVQIVQEHDRIALIVQDTGHGFDTLTQTSGMGLVNIRNRAASYNGRMDVWSEPGKGTEINVEFKLGNNNEEAV